MNEKIEKDDIEIIDFVFVKDEVNNLMAKLQPIDTLLTKLELEKYKKDYMEIYYTYSFETKISEFEVLIFNEKKKIKQDVFIEAGKNEFNIIKSKISKKLKNLRTEGDIAYVESDIS